MSSKPEHPLTEKEQLDLEGVPPADNVGDRKKFLLSEEEVFSDLDRLVQRTLPNQKDPAKTTGYIKQHGLSERAINSKIETVVPESEEVPRPSTVSTPEYFQTTIDAMERSLENRMNEVLEKNDPAEAPYIHAAIFNLRNSFRRELTQLLATNPKETELNRFDFNWREKINKLRIKYQL